MPDHHQQPSPALFFETVSAYQRTEALKAALELDLFSAIGAGMEEVPVLAARCAASERGIRILCDYLVILGFLSKEAGRYQLLPDTAVFLDRESPAFLGGTMEFLFSPMLRGAFSDTAAAVRNGGTTIPEEGTLAHDHPIWIQFAKAMAPLTTLPAEWIVEVVGAGHDSGIKVLDIAAGHGKFGITFALKHPKAEIVAVDWPAVLEVAMANALAAGVVNRYRLLPGSAFDVEFGAGYDVVLLTNFLHHFDMETCVSLLRKVHSSLRESGKVAILEFVPNEDRVSPPMAGSFSLTMLATTPSGDAYTFAEYDRMLKSAGYSSAELHGLPGMFQNVVLAVR